MKYEGGYYKNQEYFILFDIIENMPHRIAIITVVYENYTVLKDFIASLQSQTNKNFHLYCIDVSIHRYTVDYKKISGETVYAENKGYSQGINIGLKKAIEAGFSNFCLINNDVYFNKDFVDKVLISTFHHPSSIIGGKIYYAKGYEYHKRYFKSELGKVLWYAGGSVDWRNALTPHRGVDEPDSGQYDKPQETSFVNGALIIFDKTVVDEVGFWEEKYFLYFEDADFCERAKRKGIKLFYDPSIVMWHKNAQSTGGSGSNIHQKYQEYSRLRFGLKYAPVRTKLHLIKNYIISKLQAR